MVKTPFMAHGSHIIMLQDPYQDDVPPTLSKITRRNHLLNLLHTHTHTHGPCVLEGTSFGLDWESVLRRDDVCLKFDRLMQRKWVQNVAYSRPSISAYMFFRQA